MNFLTLVVFGISVVSILMESAEAATGRSESGGASIMSSSSRASGNPFVGFQFTTGASGLGTQIIRSSAGGTPFSKTPLRAQLDFQPLHSIGVLSLGPSFEYYKTKVADDFKSVKGAEPALSHAMVFGAQARYQALFFEGQAVVPMAAYSFESVSYRLSGGQKGSLRGRGTTLGAWIFLNRLDESTARTFRREVGVSRTYLTLERRGLTGDGGQVSFSGSSYQLGLRFEI